MKSRLLLCAGTALALAWLIVFALGGYAPAAASDTTVRFVPPPLPESATEEWWSAVQPALASEGPITITAQWTYGSPQATASGEGFGYTLSSAGDVNGDGYDDVAVGGRQYSVSGVGQSGRVWIFHGSGSGLPLTPTKIIDPPVLNLNGFFGAVSTAGDVNGDGYDDVLVGFENYDSTQSDEGAIFLYLGSATGLRSTHSWMRRSATLYAHFGTSVGAAGDVNGDGFDDIIAGAFRNDVNAISAAYVWHGSATFTATASGTLADANWYAHGETNGAGGGWGFGGFALGTAGDLNGDGFDDVFVGAPFWAHPDTQEGAVFVWHGSAGGLGATGTLANYDWMMESNKPNARLGWSASAAGDVNGDGYGDLIAGAYRYTDTLSSQGGVFLFYGADAGLGLTGTAANADWAAFGSQAGEVLGYVVRSAGDVNGDGYDDIAAAGYGYDIAGSPPVTNAGRVYVWLGGINGLTAADTVTHPDLVADGDQALGSLGRSLAHRAGDYNGDGLSDLLVGSDLYDNPSLVNAGRAWVYNGAAQCQARLNDNATPYYNVQAAVDASTNPADIVKVAGICSDVHARGEFTQTAYISKSLTVRGGYTFTNWSLSNPAANPTTLSALGKGRVLFVTGGAVAQIENLVVTGGDASGQEGGEPGVSTGGGALVGAATLRLNSVRVCSNTAQSGAGLAFGESDGNWIINSEIDHHTGAEGAALSLYHTAVTLTNSVLRYNHASGDGGALNLYQSRAVLQGGEVYTNSAQNGGGIYAAEADLVISGTLVRENSAATDGGGIYLAGANGEIAGTSFLRNTASGGSGGGIKVDNGGTLTLTNSTVGYNRAQWVGAGLFVNDAGALARGNRFEGNVGNEGSAATFTGGGGLLAGNFISGNTANWRSGGLAFFDHADVAVENTLIRYNLAGSEGGAVRIDESAPTFINTVVADNAVQSGIGSGIVVSGSSPLFLHLTLARNTGGDGAALTVVNAGSSVALTNTIIAHQTVGVVVPTGSAALLNGVLWHATPEQFTGPTLTILNARTGDPVFADDGYHLLPASAAVDGVASGIATDIDGKARRGLPDLGAVEAPIGLYLPAIRR